MGGGPELHRGKEFASPPRAAGGRGVSAFGLTLLTIVVHIAFAIAVFHDDKAIEQRGYDVAMLGGSWILQHTTFFERRVRSLGGHSAGRSATDAAPIG